MLESIMCLAMAVYFEARGEPMVGQVAVAQVVMARVDDHRYPNTVCEVVKQGHYYTWSPDIPILNKCHFSFWCDGKPETIEDEYAFQWQRMLLKQLFMANFMIRHKVQRIITPTMLSHHGVNN